MRGAGAGVVTGVAGSTASLGITTTATTVISR